MCRRAWRHRPLPIRGFRSLFRCGPKVTGQGGKAGLSPSTVKTRTAHLAPQGCHCRSAESTVAFVLRPTPFRRCCGQKLTRTSLPVSISVRQPSPMAAIPQCRLAADSRESICNVLRRRCRRCDLRYRMDVSGVHSHVARTVNSSSQPGGSAGGASLPRPIAPISAEQDRTEHAG